MIVSLNWIKKFVDVSLPIDELTTLIGSRLVEIEEVIDLGAKYKDVLVVKAVTVSSIKGSDHLNLVKIDDGGVSKVERDDKGLIQVVCGAPNIGVGQMVVWLQPGCIVPNTFNTSEPFELGSRKLQGYVSNGMIASPKELDLYDDHAGILVISDDVKPGDPFAQVCELDDYLLDIENKSLTHRPDCFSIIGFAREIATITGQNFHTPEFMMNLNPDFGNANDIKLKVAIDDPELSKRYQAIVVSGADGGKQSPLRIQTYLARVGVRPINAVVDVTNYLMMLTGQPLHAFDYDKVVAVGGSADIHVRAGRKNEKLELLDGKTITLANSDIVIAAGKNAIGLAGAMGGANTEIDGKTKNIIIEAATFNLYNLRSTQMRHGIYSEAITRFTKGQSADQTAPVLFDAVKLMHEWAGATVTSQVADVYPGKSKQAKIKFTADQVNEILGSDFKPSDIADLLRRSEFKVDVLHEPMELTAPYWRQDIHIMQDIVEEVGRISGFDNVNPVLPQRDFRAVRQSEFDDFRNQIRQTLIKSGGNEVLTYTFVHGDILQKAGQDTKNSYKVTNSISPSLQYYRQLLTPSLLNLVHPNIKQGFDEFALFEMNKTMLKSDGLNEEKVPIEHDHIALVISSKIQKSNSPYYHAKKFVTHLFKELNIDVQFKLSDGKSTADKLFELVRSAVVCVDDRFVGVLGEYTKTTRRNFKLPEYTAGFELDLQMLFEVVQGTTAKSRYKPISRYQFAERDICFRVKQNINYDQIINSATKILDTTKLDYVITPVDIYQSEGSQTKNITVRIRLTSFDHTLSGDEVSAVIDSVVGSVTAKTGGTVV